MIERIDYLITLSILLIKKLILKGMDNVISFFINANKYLFDNEILLMNNRILNVVVARRLVHALKFSR